MTRVSSLRLDPRILKLNIHCHGSGLSVCVGSGSGGTSEGVARITSDRSKSNASGCKSCEAASLAYVRGAVTPRQGNLRALHPPNLMMPVLINLKQSNTALRLGSVTVTVLARAAAAEIGFVKRVAVHNRSVCTAKSPVLETSRRARPTSSGPCLS